MHISLYKYVRAHEKVTLEQMIIHVRQECWFVKFAQFCVLFLVFPLYNYFASPT